MQVSHLEIRGQQIYCSCLASLYTLYFRGQQEHGWSIQQVNLIKILYPSQAVCLQQKYDFAMQAYWVKRRFLNTEIYTSQQNQVIMTLLFAWSTAHFHPRLFVDQSFMKLIGPNILDDSGQHSQESDIVMAAHMTSNVSKSEKSSTLKYGFFYCRLQCLHFCLWSNRLGKDSHHVRHRCGKSGRPGDQLQSIGWLIRYPRSQRGRGSLLSFAIFLLVRHWQSCQ